MFPAVFIRCRPCKSQMVLTQFEDGPAWFCRACGCVVEVRSEGPKVEPLEIEKEK